MKSICIYCALLSTGLLQHIAQLQPHLAANQDVIAAVQAGFIGAWGEWHSSTNDLLSDPQDRRDILQALLDALPASRMTQIRYSPYKEEMYGGPLSQADAFGGSYGARTGHHNDCFLSSDTDVGTYPSGQAEQWKVYLEQDTKYVPMGGETCEVHDRGLLDPRRWLPGAPIELHLQVQLPTDLAAGAYDIAIALPDASASLAERQQYAIRFANDDVWANPGYNRLASIQVDASAAGDAKDDATELLAVEVN